MNSRQETILRMIVGDFVKSAKPIGSSKLVKRHKMGCCSATVRNDMSVLEDEGYIKQAHLSSGRIPTGKGYRYFVDKLVSNKDIPIRFRRRIMMTIQTLDSSKYSQAVRVLAEEVANMTNNLTVVTLPSDRIQMSGLRFLLEHPEFRRDDVICQVGQMLDRMDQVLHELKQDVSENDYKVFMGDELKFDFTKDIAIVLRKFRDPFGEEHLFGSVGPMRMDYAILPGVMEFASKVLEDF